MKHFNLTLKQFVIVNVLLLCGALYGYSTENPISIKKENLPFKTGSDIDIQTISEITPSEAYRYLKNNNYQWIDYRPETEVKSFGKISNAVWYYYSSPDFTNRISRLNRNGNYIIFGSTGNANSQVLSAFRKLGFRNVRAIKGGFVEWKRQNYPILTSGSNEKPITKPVIKPTPVQNISEIDASDAYSFLKNNNYKWIDYRPDREINLFGKISNANWYYYSSDSDFTNKIARLDRNGNYIVFGSTGNVNEKILSIFRNLGFRNVRAIKGGFSDWKRRNYPILAPENGSSKPSFPPSGIYSLEASEAIKYVNSSQVIWLDLRKHKLPNIDFITNLNSEIQSSSNFLIRAQVDRLDKTKHYIFFTDKGSRNSSIRKIFKDKRFKNVKSVGGGYRDLNSYFHKEHK